MESALRHRRHDPRQKNPLPFQSFSHSSPHSELPVLAIGVSSCQARSVHAPSVPVPLIDQSSHVLLRGRQKDRPCVRLVRWQTRDLGRLQRESLSLFLFAVTVTCPQDERLLRNFPMSELWVYDPLIQKW